MKYRALIFDFDGTIADTIAEVFRIFNEMAPDYGFRQVATEEIAPLRQLSLPELIKELGIPKHRVPGLLTRGRRMMHSQIEQLPLITGIEPVLRELRPHFECFGVLTSNSRENVELFLKTHRIDDLFNFVSSKSRLSGKASHLRAMLTTFSWKPSEILYIGDELRDIKACYKAGIDIAAVTWGFNAREALQAAHPKLLIDHPSELMQLTR